MIDNNDSLIALLFNLNSLRSYNGTNSYKTSKLSFWSFFEYFMIGVASNIYIYLHPQNTQGATKLKIIFKYMASTLNNLTLFTHHHSLIHQLPVYLLTQKQNFHLQYVVDEFLNDRYNPNFDNNQAIGSYIHSSFDNSF